MRSEQSKPNLLRLDMRRTEAAALLQKVTPGSPFDYAIPGALHPSSLSRQKNGDDSNIVYRQDVVFEAMARAPECTEAHARAIIAHYQSVVAELFEPEHDLRAAFRHEQCSDTVEDLFQLDAAYEPAKLSRWIEAAEMHVGDVVVAIAAARRELANSQLRAVA